MDRSTLGERASHGQNYLTKESQPRRDLPYEREPAKERSTLGERASHGQIYLRRESQPWTDLPDERARNGQIYLKRQHAMGRST